MKKASPASSSSNAGRMGNMRDGGAAESKAARKQLTDQLTASARVFPARGWFLGQEYNLADCAWAVLFHHLAPLGLKLPSDMQAMVGYAQRLFMRPAFQRSVR